MGRGLSLKITESLLFDFIFSKTHEVYNVLNELILYFIYRFVFVFYIAHNLNLDLFMRSLLPERALFVSRYRKVCYILKLLIASNELAIQHQEQTKEIIREPNDINFLTILWLSGQML